MRTTSLTILVALSLGFMAENTKAGTFTSDFNNGTAPAGTTVNGNSVVEATGGVDNSGVLKLTKALNSQSGSFVIDDLDAGASVYGFDLTAKVRVGGGTSTPADGFSINFDPTASSTSTTGEEGTTGGLTFAFDIYDNGSETPPAPSIDFKVGGSLVATHKMSITNFDTGADFVNLHITVGADGAVSMAWKDAVIFTNIFVPNYAPLQGASFVIGARTGGANENQFFDNLSITTYTHPKVGITQQPLSATLLKGQNVTLSVSANNAESATYQWFKNGTAVAGATQANLTLSNVAVADSGTKYKVTLTGPNNAVTSDEVTLSVKDIPLPAAPAVSYDFNSGTLPANASAFGSATVVATGGTSNSGYLQLTTDIIDQAGAFIVPLPGATAAVYGLTVQFDVLVRSAGATPADGFSFNFATDIPDDPTVTPPRGLEEGTGSGISVVFDIYNNGAGEAPSIDVTYKNKTIASTKLPLSFVTTGDQFEHVIIHLENDGTIDVVYKGVVVIDNVAIPQFSSITGGRIALAGRTGGASADQWFDNLQITPDTTSGSLRITIPPAVQTVTLGKTGTFTVQVNDTAGVTYQWFKDGNAISGATSSTYTTPAAVAGDTGSKYKVTATRGNETATSADVALTVYDVSNPTVSYDFTSTTAPAGTVLVGNDPTMAGYILDGVLHLVDAINSAAGAFVIDPLLSGAEIGTFTASFDIRVGGGSTPPADGFSFSFAPDAVSATVGGAEDGSGTGLTVGFDIYDNANETPPAPSIDVRYKGAVVASVQLPYTEIETGEAFKNVLIHLSADGKVDVVYGGRVLFNGVALPNYTPISNGKFGFYGRTGGLNENVWLDNIVIAAAKSTAPLRITQDLSDVAVLPGTTQTFAITLSDPNGATYQWLKNGTAIAGATTASYTTSAFTAADTGATYSVRATGPGGTVNSHAAVVTVVTPITVSNPKISFDFNDGQVPPGAEFNGSTTAANGDGILHLTDAVNSLGGSLIISDVDNGQAVSGFTARFKLLVGGGSTPPADGLSFVWVTDLPSGTIFGEDGSGTGLIISFDIYNNGNETPPAPSIDARYNGTTVATVQMPYQQMETGTTFADFIVRVEPDGTLDLHYKNMVIFNNVKLPGFKAMTGAVFAIGARTGGLNENQWIDDLQIATTTGSVAPQFSSITKDATGKVVIQWSGTGTLQSTDSLTNPTWTTVTGATSPYTVDPAGARMKFYRLAP